MFANLLAVIIFSFSSLYTMDTRDAVYHHYSEQAKKYTAYELNELIRTSLVTIWCLKYPDSEDTKKYLVELAEDAGFTQKQLLKRLEKQTIENLRKQYRAYHKAFLLRFKDNAKLHDNKELVASFIEKQRQYDKLFHLNQTCSQKIRSLQAPHVAQTQEVQE